MGYQQSQLDKSAKLKLKMLLCLLCLVSQALFINFASSQVLSDLESSAVENVNVNMNNVSMRVNQQKNQNEPMGEGWSTWPTRIGQALKPGPVCGHDGVTYPN